MKKYRKLIVDAVMSALLLLLMAYELIDAAVHEWLGIAMFVLVILHHVLNRKWSGNVLKGKYSPLRVLQTVLVALVLISMLGSMVSGIILSRHALAFLPIHGGTGWARTVHLLCGYWGFVLMGLHLGLHWSVMVGIAGKSRKVSNVGAWACRLAGLLAAVYGAYAFVKRGQPGYMFLQNQFVFFDFSEPIVLFLLDYLAIMGLFIWIGHYLSQLVKKPISWENRHRK